MEVISIIIVNRLSHVTTVIYSGGMPLIETQIVDGKEIEAHSKTVIKERF